MSLKINSYKLLIGLIITSLSSGCGVNETPPFKRETAPTFHKTEDDLAIAVGLKNINNVVQIEQQQSNTGSFFPIWYLGMMNKPYVSSPALVNTSRFSSSRSFNHISSPKSSGIIAKGAFFNHISSPKSSGIIAKGAFSGGSFGGRGG